MSNSSGRSQADTTPSPLDDALDKNKQAAAEVKQAADDLALVHAVLDTKLAKGADEDDVKRAVAETNIVEKRLGRSAEKLDRVNESLEQEVRRIP